MPLPRPAAEEHDVIGDRAGDADLPQAKMA